jgi:hypothetical protein
MPDQTEQRKVGRLDRAPGHRDRIQPRALHLQGQPLIAEISHQDLALADRPVARLARVAGQIDEHVPPAKGSLRQLIDCALSGPDAPSEWSDVAMLPSIGR